MNSTSQTKPEFYIPLPDALSAYRETVANFGILFQKYAPYDNAALEHKKTIERIAGKSATVLQKAKDELRRLHESHARVVDVMANNCSFKAKLLAPLITGIGNAHASEVGMTLDRNTGLPYIPSSSIKGVVRMAYCIELYNAAVAGDPEAAKSIDPSASRKGRDIGISIRDDDPGLVHLFGHPNPGSKDASRGQVVFLDAFPETVPELHLDIMNPHFSKYYQDGDRPVETESPIPIKFLTVRNGTRFVFRWFVRALRGEKAVTDKELDFIERAFERALTDMGLGAKTAIGYGRFSIEGD